MGETARPETDGDGPTCDRCEDEANHRAAVDTPAGERLLCIPCMDALAEWIDAEWSPDWGVVARKLIAMEIRRFYRDDLGVRVRQFETTLEDNGAGREEISQAGHRLLGRIEEFGDYVESHLQNELKIDVDREYKMWQRD